MERGTTPQHTFNIPADISPAIKEVKITYAQDGKEILVKRTADCTLEPGKIITKLTQEDTFLFNSNKLVHIQIRVLTLGGDCVKSQVLTTSAGACLDNEVLV